MGTPQVAQRWRDLAEQLEIDKPERFERLLTPWDTHARATLRERADWLESAFKAVRAAFDSGPMPQFSLALDSLLEARDTADRKARLLTWHLAYLKEIGRTIKEDHRVLLALRASVAEFRRIREHIRVADKEPLRVGPAAWLDDPEVVTKLLDALWPHLEPFKEPPPRGWTRDRPGRPRSDDRRPIREALKKAGIPSRWPRRPKFPDAVSTLRACTTPS